MSGGQGDDIRTQGSRRRNGYDLFAVCCFSPRQMGDFKYNRDPERNVKTLVY